MAYLLSKEKNIKSLIKANAKEIYDSLEDDNYHKLNNFLSLSGYFGDKYKNRDIKSYENHPKNFLNPQIIEDIEGLTKSIDEGKQKLEFPNNKSLFMELNNDKKLYGQNGVFAINNIKLKVKGNSSISRVEYIYIYKDNVEQDIAIDADFSGIIVFNLKNKSEIATFKNTSDGYIKLVKWLIDNLCK